MNNIELERIGGVFAVCKLNSAEGADLTRQFVFFSKTDGELSLVCEEDAAPPDAVETEGGFLALRVRGPLDFSLVGVIARISGILAEAGVGLFVVSTYDTDYILIKDANAQKAAAALENGGITVDWHVNRAAPTRFS